MDSQMSSIQCNGFQASGIAAGIKKKAGSRDLGLIVSDTPATVAGIFTTNQVQAAPVVLSRERVVGGVCRGIIINSGCANCYTGETGMEHARQMTQQVASLLGVAPEEILVASTGVIGAQLPMERLQTGIPAAVQALAPQGWPNLAEAIMTTDTVPKLLQRQGVIDGCPFSIVATAKGAGMICPNMATMLCFACTDVAVEADRLSAMLREAVNPSLNSMTVDGDMSTNDTVLLLANGRSGVRLNTPERVRIFQKQLNGLLLDMAKWLLQDAEGATKLVTIWVEGAATSQEARRIADTIANSSLVKTAFFGQDANWGRIIAAAGRAGVTFDPACLDVAFDDVLMVQQGQYCGAEAENRVTRIMHQPAFTLRLNLHTGKARACVYTCDFSIDYVKINADYRS